MLLPSVTIIVPSYNQAAYLEETLRSIIDQRYPNLQLIVIDGGSTDGSVDIIQRYSAYINHWVSEPDRGQSHAINKGIEKATGEWIAWMNSDDCYLPNTLVNFFNSFNHENYDFIHGLSSSGVDINNRAFRVIKKNRKRTTFHILRFFMGTEFIIPSQSVFVRRSILAKVGFLNEELSFVMDMEWFARISLITPPSKIYFYSYSISFYRKHTGTKTHNYQKEMYDEACKVAIRLSSRLPTVKRIILVRLIKGHKRFYDEFSACSTIFQWLNILMKYPLHARYSVSYWAKLKMMVFRKVGLPIKTYNDYLLRNNEQ